MNFVEVDVAVEVVEVGVSVCFDFVLLGLFHFSCF